MMRVCFATPGVLPMLRQAEGTVYGGSELRAWRFARGLADLDFDVSIAVAGGEVAPLDILGPVHIHGAAGSSGWLPRLIGRLAPRANSDAGLWANADADVYVAFGAAEYNADLADWCKANGRPMLLFAGSDADFSVEYRPGNSGRNLWGSRCDRCYDSVMGATALVVQTDIQKRWAQERYRRDSDVVANPVAIGDLTTASWNERFLWIGKAVNNKRPDLMLAIARACPEQSFVMILNDVGNGLFEEMARNKGNNVEVVQSVAPDLLGPYFERARALVCTSDFEGFPNTFLDAGRFGVPILSLSVDPDGVVEREGGGFVAGGNLDRLIEAVRCYANDQGQARAAGQRWHDYVRRNHNIKDRVAEFSAIVRKTVEAHRAMRVPQ